MHPGRSQKACLCSVSFSANRHGDSRAQLSDLRKELEKYIGKLGSKVVDSKVQFSVNYMFQKMKKKKKTKKTKSTQDKIPLLPAQSFDSETGEILKEENLEIQSESSKNSLYMMQNLRIGKSNCLTFVDFGANPHLIDGTLAKEKKLQKFSDNRADLGVIGVGAITLKTASAAHDLGVGASEPRENNQFSHEDED